MAIKKLSDLLADLATVFANNNDGDITPLVLRDQQTDTIDSSLNKATGNSTQTVESEVDFTGGLLINGVGVPAYAVENIVETTPSLSFSSVSPADVPDLTFDIVTPGDYILYAAINAEFNPDLEGSISFSKNGTTESDSILTVYNKKNKEFSIQNTYLITGLVATDTITVRLDTGGDNGDLAIRRFILQSWG